MMGFKFHDYNRVRCANCFHCLLEDGGWCRCEEGFALSSRPDGRATFAEVMSGLIRQAERCTSYQGEEIELMHSRLPALWENPYFREVYRTGELTW